MATPAAPEDFVDTLHRRSGAELLALGQKLVTASPAASSAWLCLALGLLLSQRAAQLYSWLLPQRRRHCSDHELVFLKDAFLVLAQRKAHDAILAAAAAAPPGTITALIPTYFAACVLLARRRFDEGFALLSGFRNGCLANLAALPVEDSDGFMVLFRHALLVTGPDYPASDYFRDQLAANRVRLDDLKWQTPPPAEAEGDEARPPVLMVSCDQVYADRFLARFLDSVDRCCQDRLVHLHLIDPASEPPLPVAEPARNRLAVTWERSGSLRCSAWYASARFVRMAELLDHYRRPILCFDVDVALNHPPEPVEQALGEADFGCFRMDRHDPGSVYQASVTAFRPSPAGIELAVLLRDLILSKMSIQRPLLWLIDQACLYSAITQLGDLDGRLRVADFTAALGMTVHDYVTFGGSAEEKLGMMIAASSPAAGTADPAA